MSFLKTNGINTHYQVHGKGEPLILISGLGGNLNFWQTSIEPLSKFYQVVIFDTRGSGRSDAPAGPYSMEMLAADVLGLMDALDITKANILGFSMGGAVALTFAHLYPNRILKLIVAASFSVMNPQIRLFLDAVQVVFEINQSSKQMFDLIVPWLFSAKFLEQPENSIYVQFDDSDPDQQSFKAWKNQYTALREFNISGYLSSISTPTLLIAGQEDRLAHVEDSHRLLTEIPNSKMIVIPGTGHLLNYEQPAVFHQSITDFLNK